MIPKIVFTYSFPYDNRFRQLPTMKEYLSKRKEEYPTPKQIENFIRKIEGVWKKDEEKILREISRSSGLNWKEKEIKCYVIGIGRGLSSPLTMKITKSPIEFIDTLIHEMIHNIQSQNLDKFEKWLKYTNKYKNEDPITIRHIFLHALHNEICLKLFNKKRLSEIIKSESIPNYKNRETSEDQKYYKRSWQIVEEEGYENIIKKFREVTK